MVCAPGLAHQRLTPDNCHDLLFDDVISLQQARRDHFDFAAKMVDRGVEDVIEQELGNLLPAEQSLATVLTMIEADRDGPALGHPTKPIGPYYDQETPERLKSASGWTFATDVDGVHTDWGTPRQAGNEAALGSLDDIARIVDGTAGTRVNVRATIPAPS